MDDMKSTTDKEIVEDLKGIYSLPEIGAFGASDSEFHIKARKLSWQVMMLESTLEIDDAGIDVTTEYAESEDEETALVTATCRLDTLLLRHFGSFVPDDDEELTEERHAEYEADWEEAVRDIVTEETGWNVEAVEYFRYNSFAGTNTYRLTLSPPALFVVAEGRYRWIAGAGMVLDA